MLEHVLSKTEQRPDLLAVKTGMRPLTGQESTHKRTLILITPIQKTQYIVRLSVVLATVMVSDGLLLCCITEIH